MARSRSGSPIQEHKASLIRIQREQAEAAAAKIEHSSTRSKPDRLDHAAALVGGTLEQRRFDALRLLRQVPAITELSQLDATGQEQLRVSRLAMDVVGSGTDYSHEPKFTEAWPTRSITARSISAANPSPT